MARISLFYTVTGGRPLPCRSFSLAWQRGLVSATTEKLMPPRMGGGNVAAVPPRPFATMRLGSHWRAAGSQIAWRKGSHHIHRGVATDPEVLLRRLQQQQTARAKDTEGDDAGLEAEAEMTNDEGNAIRKFKSQSKRMLKIPHEEWPR